MSMSGKGEENSRLRNLNQRMIEQVKKLKDEKLEKSLEVKIQVVERGKNKDLIELLSTNKSPEALKIEVSKNKTQETETPY